MKEISVLIAEDDAVVALNLSFTLQGWGYKVIGPLAHAEQVAEACRQFAPDVLLLDIDLAGEMNGIEAAEQVRRALGLPTIFLTAHGSEQMFEQAKRTHPAAYLLKPFDAHTLKNALHLAVYNQQFAQPRAEEQPAPQVWDVGAEIFVRSRSRLVKVRLLDICWLQAEDTYTVLGTERGEFLASAPLKLFEERLPASHFRRVHRSFIVNLQRVEAVEEGVLVLGDKQVPIGKTYREGVMGLWTIL